MRGLYLKCYECGRVFDLLDETDSAESAGHDCETDSKTQEVSECLSCQYARVWKDTGSWPSPEAERHWSLWGCTCDPDTEADALAHMRSVTE